MFRKRGQIIHSRLTRSFSGSLVGYYSSMVPSVGQIGSFLLVGMALFIVSFVIPVVAPLIFALNYGRKRRSLNMLKSWFSL